jgi:hypothetical protein
MSGNRSVPSSPRQILSILIGDVLSLTIAETLGQAKIYDEDRVFRRLRPTYQEVVRLDISMNNPLFVDLLDSRDHLDSAEEARLQIKVPLTRRKEVFK